MDVMAACTVAISMLRRFGCRALTGGGFASRASGAHVDFPHRRAQRRRQYDRSRPSQLLRPSKPSTAQLPSRRRRRHRIRSCRGRTGRFFPRSRRASCGPPSRPADHRRNSGPPSPPPSAWLPPAAQLSCCRRRGATAAAGAAGSAAAA